VAAAAQAQAAEKEAIVAVAAAKKSLKQKEWRLAQVESEHEQEVAKVQGAAKLLREEAEAKTQMLEQMQAQMKRLQAEAESQAQAQAQAQAESQAQIQAQALVEAHAEAHSANLSALAHSHDSQATAFLNALLEQQVAELASNAERIQAALEEVESRHHVEVRRLGAERVEYEANVNDMMAKMAEQMMAIQSMALNKISGLEAELEALRSGGAKK
jgi:hypothetical protein